MQMVRYASLLVPLVVACSDGASATGVRLEVTLEDPIPARCIGTGELRLWNAGSSAVELTGLDFDVVGAEVALRDVPLWPVTLDPGRMLEIPLSWQADEGGRVRGTAIVRTAADSSRAALDALVLPLPTALETFRDSETVVLSQPVHPDFSPEVYVDGRRWNSGWVQAGMDITFPGGRPPGVVEVAYRAEMPCS